jgi:hypothetical protein
MALAKQKNE